jgi:hypothetical protein
MITDQSDWPIWLFWHWSNTGTLCRWQTLPSCENESWKRKERHSTRLIPRSLSESKYCRIKYHTYTTKILMMSISYRYISYLHKFAQKYKDFTLKVRYVWKFETFLMLSPDYFSPWEGTESLSVWWPAHYSGFHHGSSNQPNPGYSIIFSLPLVYGALIVNGSRKTDQWVPCPL